MYNTVQGEAVFFFASIVSGVLLAVLYDIIRISRRIVRVNVSAVGAQDILFFAAAAVVLFCAAYTKNGGEAGLHGIFGGVLGAGLYAYIVRNRFVNLGTTVVKWLIKAALWVLRTAAFPVKIVLRALKKPVDIVAWYTGRGLRRARHMAGCGKARAKMRLRAALSMVRKK